MSERATGPFFEQESHALALAKISNEKNKQVILSAGYVWLDRWQFPFRLFFLSFFFRFCLHVLGALYTLSATILTMGMGTWVFFLGECELPNDSLLLLLLVERLFSTFLVVVVKTLAMFVEGRFCAL